MADVRKTLQSWGRDRFDYLVNNAGGSLHANFDQTTEAQFDEIVNVHFKGVYFLTRKLLPLIKDGGRILAQGRDAEALAEIEKETGEWQKLSGEALAYDALGRRTESDAALKKLIATHQNDCAYQIAEVYASRGEADKAFHWLDRAIQQRDPGTPELKTGPLMKSLRRDPRYAELLKKMRLPA